MITDLVIFRFFFFFKDTAATEIYPLSLHHALPICLDLELWVPALLDKANNTKVTEGGPGYVAAYAGIDLLDIPTSFSRAQGDIHVYGNPHIWTDPMNAVQIARNILTGLRRVSPENAEYFSGREKDFE